MERLGTIEIEVLNADESDMTWGRKTLYGEEAREWLRDHNALGDDPRVEQDRAEEMSVVLMAAAEQHIKDSCKQEGCEGCATFERGMQWMVGTLPTAYRRRVVEHSVLALLHEVGVKAGSV